MDNNSFNESQDLKWANKIIPIFQPPVKPSAKSYLATTAPLALCPELNHIERLWEHIKSKLA